MNVSISNLMVARNRAVSTMTTGNSTYEYFM